MELILHTGTHKTGSTAIQVYLTENRDFLLREHRVLYPKPFPDRKQINHVSIPFSIRRRAGFNEIMNDLNKQLSDMHGLYDKVLISTEEFSPIRPQLISHICYFVNKLREFINIDRVKIIVYLRRQDKYIESLYSEVIKNPSSLVCCYIDDFIKCNMNLNYYTKIKNLQAALNNLGVEARVIPFMYIQGMDAVEHFVKNVIYVDSQEKSTLSIPSKRVNVSFSKETILALRKLKEDYEIPLDIYRNLLAFVANFDSKTEKNYLKGFLSLEQRLNILEYYKKENTELFREFWELPNMFYLDEEEEEYYKRHDEFVKANWHLIQEEIDRRYQIFLAELGKLLNGQLKENIFKIHWAGYKGIYGVVDTLNPEFVSGWVYNSNVNDNQGVIINVEGYDVCKLDANIHREDIMEIFNLPMGYKTNFKVSWKEIQFPLWLIDYLRSLDKEKVKVIIKEKYSGLAIYTKVTEVDKDSLLNNISRGITKGYIDDLVYTKDCVIFKGWLVNTIRSINSLSTEHGKVVYGLKRVDVMENLGLEHADRCGFVILVNDGLNKIPLRIKYEGGDIEEVFLEPKVGEIIIRGG